VQRIRLIHWTADEAAAKAKRLRAAGYAVEHEPPAPRLLQRLRREPPGAIVIDLSRLPSQGRDVALAIRESKSLLAVPLVFVDGDPGKVRRIQGLLPDATYTSWSRIRGALRRATARPAAPAAPHARMDAYAKTPLVRKLGIKPGTVVALVGAPPGFVTTLGALPAGAKWILQAGKTAHLIVWFVRSRAALARGVGRMAARVGPGGLWIAWPKQASGAATDLTQSHVRAEGLAAGLVDYKICAVDAEWSGLKFARRSAGRRQPLDSKTSR